MSIIIRLQNLPWSANSVDIRRFFGGLSIPEGGVHIVGGEMGDAFIAFSTDEDARLAMAKDGGKIKDMQIRLLLSSRTEMMRVIEQARQQNVVVAQPPMQAMPQMQHLNQMQHMPQMQAMTHQMQAMSQMQQMPQMQAMPHQMQQMPLEQPARSMPDSDRRRERSPPTRHRSRDRSSSRDRRRSPNSRRRESRDSKRDRSRSPRSRGYRDDRRREERSKRDDRRYDDSRYRDERRSSARDEPEPIKYPDNERSQQQQQTQQPQQQQQPNEGFRDIQKVYDAVQNIAMSGLFPYGTQQLQAQNAAAKSIHDSVQSAASSMDLFKTGPFADPAAQGNSTSVEQQQEKRRRRSRFEPDNPQQTNLSESQSQSSAYSIKRTGNITENRNAWQQGGPNVASSNTITANGDLVQVVEMDIDPPEPGTLIETVAPNASYSYGRPENPAPSMTPNSQSAAPNRGSPMRNDPRGQHLYNEGLNRMNANNELMNRGPQVQGDVNRNSPLRGGMDMFNSAPQMPVNNQNRIPSSLAVEVRGLPPDASITDILDLFRGISLPAANIRIEASDRGFEKAYIRFTSVEDFEEALNRNRHFVNQGRCELVPCPESAFEGARAQRGKPRPKPREEDLIIQLRGLPFGCKDDDIIAFFDGLSILDIYVQRMPDGRATGLGFVEFGSHKDFRSALSMNGKMIGHRYITISVGGKDLLESVRGDEHRPDPAPRNFQRAPRGASPPRPALLPSQVRPPGPSRQPPACVFLKNLPEGVTNRNIADFLGQAQIMPRAIHIMLRPDNQMPSGEAYAEFSNPVNLQAALQLSGKVMAGKAVEISPISFLEMSEILGRPVQPPPSEGVGLLRPPTAGMERPPRAPLIPQGPRERLPHADFPPRSMRSRMDGPPGRPSQMFGGPGRMRGPWPSRPRMDGRFPGQPPSDRGPKDFGAPGCVVAINNLHFKAGLEELLDFFKGHKITKDSIIRKYNENGQTTGEARVAFQSPQEAQSVVRELNHRQIMGRCLNLSVL